MNVRLNLNKPDRKETFFLQDVNAIGYSPNRNIVSFRSGEIVMEFKIDEVVRMYISEEDED